MNKKFAALAMAAAMLVGSSMTVFATDSTLDTMDKAGAGATVSGSATVTVPTIKVTVPTTAAFVINPFQTAYNAGGISGNDQIISKTQEIKNESDLAVAINVVDLKATKPVAGTIAISAASAAKATTKSVYLYVEVTKKDVAADPAKNRIAAPAVTALQQAPATPASKNAIVILDAGKTTPQIATFKIGGDVAANPTKTVTVQEGGKNVSKTVADPWLDSDQVELSFKFTFTPQIIAR